MMWRHPGGWFVVSLLLALWLQFLPLSPNLSLARPLWLAMALGYWALYGPNVSTIGAALLLGLAADTLYDAPLGQHVIGLTLMVYTLIRLRSELGLYPLWQVTLLLVPAWALYGLLMFVFDGMAKHPSPWLARTVPVLSSLVVWPLLAVALDLVRGKRITL